jgi:hypothetical protein
VEHRLAIGENIEAELEQSLFIDKAHFKILLLGDTLYHLPVKDGEAHFGYELRVAAKFPTEAVVHIQKLVVELCVVDLFLLSFILVREIFMFLVEFHCRLFGFIFTIRIRVHFLILLVPGFGNALHLIEFSFEVVHFAFEFLVGPHQSANGVRHFIKSPVQDAVLLFSDIVEMVI